MSYAIEVSGLTKRFGDTLAVDDLSFTVAAGRIVGFLRPNGAGQTTTLCALPAPGAPEDRPRGALCGPPGPRGGAPPRSRAAPMRSSTIQRAPPAPCLTAG